MRKECQIHSEDYRDAGLMLCHRLRRWHSKKQHWINVSVFAGCVSIILYLMLRGWYIFFWKVAYRLLYIAAYPRVGADCRAKQKGSICYFTSKQILPFVFAEQSRSDIPAMPGIHPMLYQCWPTVFDAGPTLKQHLGECTVLAGDAVWTSSCWCR